MRASLQNPIFEVLLTDEGDKKATRISKSLALVRNEFSHKDQWYNLFQDEEVERFLTADPSLNPPVFPFYSDNNPDMQAEYFIGLST